MTTGIVGAGLAGIFAARRLQEFGEEVVVLEATAHLGGRTRGDRNNLRYGAVADLGASFLDRGQDRLLAFCLEHGIDLSPELRMFPKGPGSGYSGASILLGNLVLDGHKRDRGTREALAGEVQDALGSAPPTVTETLVAWAYRVGLSRPAARAYAMQAGFNPVHRGTLTSTWHAHPGDIGRLCWTLRDSTDTIASTAAEGLDIRLGQPVRVVSRTGRAYRIQTDVEDLVVDDVILTTSVIAARRIGFDPVLPAWKVEALLGTPMSQGGKIIAQYRDGASIWDAAGPSTLTDSPVSMFWLRRTGQDTVTAMGTMPDTGDGILEDHPAALAVLDRQIEAMSGFSPERIGGIVQNWTTDEFVGGVVSMGTGGVERRAALAAAVGGLHFAGEATGERWASAMEGAARSGERAADEILLKRRNRPVLNTSV